MKLSTSAVFFSFASLVACASIQSRNCPQASQFGALDVFPATVSPGDDISITLFLNCPIENFGFIPQFLDYTIEVPAASNNGHEQPVVLARRTYDFVPGTIQPTDTFTAQVPHASFVAGAPYNVVVNMVYPINGTDGSAVLVEGSTSFAITINA